MQIVRKFQPIQINIHDEQELYILKDICNAAEKYWGPRWYDLRRSEATDKDYARKRIIDMLMKL